MSHLVPFALLAGPPGPGEYILLLVVVLLFFGPKRLPEIVRGLGRVIEELRRASQEFRDEIMRIEEPPHVTPPEADRTARLPEDDAEGQSDAGTGEDERDLVG